MFLLARAFSSGCAALTGVEAISNGVPAFRKPKSRNAATTLLLLAADRDLDDDERHRARQPDEHPLRRPARARPAAAPPGAALPEGYDQHPVIAQIADGVFDDFSPAFYFVVTVTGVILVLAANTAFNGFPVLGFDPGPGRAGAALARLPRRPAGLQQRHRLPRRDVDAC